MSTEKNNASSPASIRYLRAALLLIGFLGAVSAAAQGQTGCTAAAEGMFPLTLNTTVASSKGTDEWNSDVIKIAVQEPGLLLVSAEGPEVQGLVYTPDSAGGAPHLLAEEGIGSGGRILVLAVDPGDYCLYIAPPNGTSGSVRVQAGLVDLTASSE